MSEKADISWMEPDEWKDRLAAAIENCGMSQREISLAAGLGPGYVNSIFMEGKDPTVGNLLKVCRAAGVSVFRVLGGFEMTRDEEEFLKLLLSADDAVKQSILLLLQRGQKREENQAPPDVSRDPHQPKPR